MKSKGSSILWSPSKYSKCSFTLFCPHFTSQTISSSIFPRSGELALWKLPYGCKKWWYWWKYPLSAHIRRNQALITSFQATTKLLSSNQVQNRLGVCFGQNTFCVRKLLVIIMRNLLRHLNYWLRRRSCPQCHLQWQQVYSYGSSAGTADPTPRCSIPWGKGAQGAHSPTSGFSNMRREISQKNRQKQSLLMGMVIFLPTKAISQIFSFPAFPITFLSSYLQELGLCRLLHLLGCLKPLIIPPSPHPKQKLNPNKEILGGK